MAKRHTRYAQVSEYFPLHITAVGTGIAVGHAVATSQAGAALTAGSVQTVTPVSMANIFVGAYLNISGVGTPEDVYVTAVTPTTFSAFFVNAHSGTIQITGKRGTFLGRLVINQPGTGITITLYNGNPANTTTNGFAAIAVLTGFTVGQTFDYEITCDFGLFYTVAGTTAGDYTLTYLDHDN